MTTTLPRAGSTLIVGDTPIERRGLALARADAWIDMPSRVLPDTARVPGMTGGRFDGYAPSAPRDIGLTMTLVDVLPSQLQAELRALHRMFAGLLELRWSHAPGFVQYGIAGPIVPKPIVDGKDFLPGRGGRQSWRIAVTVRCADSASYSVQPTRVKLDTTPRAIVLGALPIGGVIKLQGPVSGSVDVDLLAPNGVLLERLALRGVALADGDVCTITLDAPHTITKRTAAGVVTSVYAWRSLTLSTGWWHVSPHIADPGAGLYPLARLSAGTGWWTYRLAEAA